MRQKLLTSLAAIALSASACEGNVEAPGGGGATSTSSSGGGAGASGGGEHSSVCPGVAPWPQGTKTCHTTEECSPVEVCVPAPLEGCDTCKAASKTCALDTDCFSGVCQTYTLTGPCICPNGETGTMCVQHCSTAPCEEGFACEPAGHCLPISCAQGFVCGLDLVCDEASPFADQHGCAPTPCDAGFTCAPGDACAKGSPEADPHGCAPIHCNDGFMCPVSTYCSATTPGHGCALHSCATDADCDCGACVEGWCAPQIGICDAQPQP